MINKNSLLKRFRILKSVLEQDAVLTHGHVQISISHQLNTLKLLVEFSLENQVGKNGVTVGATREQIQELYDWFNYATAYAQNILTPAEQTQFNTKFPDHANELVNFTGAFNAIQAVVLQVLNHTPPLTTISQADAQVILNVINANVSMI